MSNEKKPESKDVKKEPALPVQIPLSILRWILYSIFMFLLLLPVPLTLLQAVCMSLLLGHFSGQLNALRAKS